MKWTYFAGAAILAAYLLITNGAPPLAVLLGLTAAAAIGKWRAA